MVVVHKSDSAVGEEALQTLASRRSSGKKKLRKKSSKGWASKKKTKPELQPRRQQLPSLLDLKVEIEPLDPDRVGVRNVSGPESTSKLDGISLIDHSSLELAAKSPLKEEAS